MQSSGRPRGAAYTEFVRCSFRLPAHDSRLSSRAPRGGTDEHDGPSQTFLVPGTHTGVEQRALLLATRVFADVRGYLPMAPAIRERDRAATQSDGRRDACVRSPAYIVVERNQ